MRVSALFLSYALALAAVVILLDWVTKTWILNIFAAPPYRIEVTSFFNLILTFNTGVSFGLFAQSDPRWLLVGFSVAVALGLGLWLWREPRFPLVAAFGLIIGGALGNVYDRIAYGAVVDFLDFHIGTWHWPAFNLADSAITLGAVIFLFDAFKSNRKS